MSIYEKEEYKDAKNLLQDEYAECFQKVETYIQLSNIYGPENEENCIQQILDDFLSAQKDKKQITKITGSNLRRFCDTVLKAEYNRNPHRYIIGQIIAIPLLLVSMIFLKVVFFHGDLNGNKLSDLTIGGLELTLLFIYYVLHFIKIKTARIFFYFKFSRAVSAVIYILSLYLLLLAVRAQKGIILCSYPIPLPIFIVLLVFSIALFIGYIIYDKKCASKKKSLLIEDNLNDYDQPVLEQITCPQCGKVHDYDYPRCPYCKYKNDI